MLGMRDDRERIFNLFQARQQVAGDRLQLQLPGLDLGEVQDIVEDRQKSFGRDLERLAIAPLLAAQSGAEQQFIHADDAVHGRANFMADRGQEFALGAVGGLGAVLLHRQLLHQPRHVGGFSVLRIARRLEIREIARYTLLAQFALGDVLTNAGHADRFVLRVPHQVPATVNVTHAASVKVHAKL